jgi:hypothetical protein
VCANSDCQRDSVRDRNRCRAQKVRLGYKRRRWLSPHALCARAHGRRSPRPGPESGTRRRRGARRPILTPPGGARRGYTPPRASASSVRTAVRVTAGTSSPQTLSIAPRSYSRLAGSESLSLLQPHWKLLSCAKLLSPSAASSCRSLGPHLPPPCLLGHSDGCSGRSRHRLSLARTPVPVLVPDRPRGRGGPVRAVVNPYYGIPRQSRRDRDLDVNPVCRQCRPAFRLGPPLPSVSTLSFSDIHC